tara:strand:+ start:201 stop:443 length:243 start_codon:yes stop_codon:yes gene_type:complete
MSKDIRGRVIATFESSPVKSCCASSLAKNFSFGEYDKGTRSVCIGFPLEFCTLNVYVIKNCTKGNNRVTNLFMIKMIAKH